MAEVRITIGVPVYNGERTIAQALGSLLAQTCGAFRIVISDNASTDRTQEICTEIAARDPRITYVRQAQNIGADANFDFVLNGVETEYFMWAASDDTRSPDFIEENLRFLDAHRDFVGSTCPVRFSGRDFDPVRMGDETRDEGAAGERIRRFFDVWHANGRFYSLFRTDAVVSARRGLGRFLASDWAVVIRLLAMGKLNRLDRGWVTLGRGGASHAKNFIGSFRTRWVHWPFPFWELAWVTAAAMGGQGVAARWAVGRRLLWLNWKAARDQLNYAIGRT